MLDAHSFIWISEKSYKTEIANASCVVPETIKSKGKERETIIKARIGQGTYRSLLLKKWNGKSSISDYDNQNFMVASHIKPWKDCDNQECIDAENGLLLTPDYDYLFDKGYISFEDDGTIIFSSLLTKRDFEEFNLNSNLRIKSVSEKMKVYLEYHRANVLQK